MNKKTLNPAISDAKRLAKTYNLDGVIILHFQGDKYGYASYGRDKPLCTAMKQVADQIRDDIADGTLDVDAIIHEAQIYS